MKTLLKTSILVALCALAGASSLLLQAKSCRAEQINAALNVMAYDHEVSVRINGVHLSKIEGGRSQSVRLFLADDPAIKELPAEMQQSMKQLFCLKEGDNTIEISVRPRQGVTPQGQMTISIQACNYEVPVLEYAQDPSVKERTVQGAFQVFAQQPAGFKTAVIK